MHFAVNRLIPALSRNNEKLTAPFTCHNGKSYIALQLLHCSLWTGLTYQRI